MVLPGFILLLVVLSGAAASDARADESGEDSAATEDSAAAPGPASPGIPVFAQDGAEIRLSLQAAVAAVSVRNAALGAGVSSRKDGSLIRHPAWSDGYVKPGVTATLERPDLFPGRLYGGAAVVAAWTVGDGDAYAISGDGRQATRGDVSHTDLESLYAGWRSADGAGKTADGLDLSTGRQDFVVGDGFLIGDGHYDRGKEGGYYSAGRQAWSGSAIASAALLPGRVDAFWLKGDKGSGGTSILGLNLELTDAALGTLGGGMMRVVDDNENASGYPGRRGLRIWSARFQGTPLPELPDVFLAGEWGLETNDGRGGTRKRATAWYGEAGYTWSAQPWKPGLSVRHARFSGDRSATGGDESWDPIRYGSTRGWGTWFMGEVVGQYMMFNSNEVVDQVHARAKPLDELGIGAVGYVFRYDRRDSVSRWDGATGVASRHFGNELDVYVDWTPQSWLSISLFLGHFTPGRGAREAYGASRDSQVLGTMIAAKF